MFTDGVSLSDIAAVTNNGEFGGNGSWAWLIIILAVLWGGFGFGGRGAVAAEGALDNYVLSSDFATLQRQLSDGFNSLDNAVDGIANGLCDGFYTQAQLVNGVNTNILQSTNELSRQISDYSSQNRYDALQNTNAIQKSLSDMRYENAASTCAITNAINTQTRDIIDNDNANYRALHEEIVQGKIDALQCKIAEQSQIINSLNLAASQQAQNNYLISELKPSPTPSYVVANPYCSCSCYNGTTIV